MGYNELIFREVDLNWWWKVLWKMKCPLKTKNFSWFLLTGKALTWDVLCLRGREGPGRCYLCKQSCETNFHIAVECPFTQSVWSIIEDHLTLNNLWNGITISDCFKNWCMLSDVILIKPLPIIVLWFVWKARNSSCFEESESSPAQISSYCLSMMKNLPQSIPVVPIRTILVEDIDQSYAWGYFDGSAAGDPMICGVGVFCTFPIGIIYPSKQV